MLKVELANSVTLVPTFSPNTTCTNAHKFIFKTCFFPLNIILIFLNDTFSTGIQFINEISNQLLLITLLVLGIKPVYSLVASSTCYCDHHMLCYMCLVSLLVY